MKRVLILGGGYGGLTVALTLLDGTLPGNTEIQLIDRLPYQGLKTEFYALAAGSIADAEIRHPYPDDPRLTITYGEIRRVLPAEKFVEMETGETLAYDRLVIALGCTDNYHGIPGAEEHTLSIQTFAATRRTYQVINNVRPFGRIAIVGGGLSGVELAAELRETRSDLNIRILDRGSGILSPFPEKLRAYVREWFEEREVELIGGVSAERVEPGAVHDPTRTFEADAVVWTAGIKPSPIVQALQVAKDPQGRVQLNEWYQIPDYPDIYVVGDCASLPFSPSGQAAEAQGKHVGEIIRAEWKGQEPKLDKIKLKGVLGALGRKAGFGVMGKRTVVTGRVPRVLKSGVLWMSKHHFG